MTSPSKKHWSEPIDAGRVRDPLVSTIRLSPDSKISKLRLAFAGSKRNWNGVNSAPKQEEKEMYGT
jgi:hypothetical protein